MVERMQQDPNEGLRRFLEDLRDGGDRRTGRDRRSGRDRRQHSVPVARERRSGADRRSGLERRMGDRRRPLAKQFSLDDSESIRQMVVNPERQVACPCCEGNLLLGPPEDHDGIVMQEIHCTGCRRNVLLVDRNGD